MLVSERGRVRKCDKLKINDKGRETPVADAATLVEIAWLCPGKAAVTFRRKGAESVCRMLHGDLSLVETYNVGMHRWQAQQKRSFCWQAIKAIITRWVCQSCPTA